MKYCIVYNNNQDFKYMDKIDEIRIIWYSINKETENIIAKYPNIDIILYIKDDAAPDTPLNTVENYFNMLLKKYPNVRLEIDYRNDGLKMLAKKNNWRFFFSDDAASLPDVYSYLQYPVTDINLNGDLCFRLDDIAEYAHSKNVKVRVCPNNAIAMTDNLDFPDMLKFFIRPEDIGDYEPYVDVMDLFVPKGKASLYYKVYAIQKKWFGTLSEILSDFNSNVDSRTIIPSFGKVRTRCGHRCMYGKCHICEHVQKLSENLKEHKQIFVPRNN